MIDRTMHGLLWTRVAEAGVGLPVDVAQEVIPVAANITSSASGNAAEYPGLAACARRLTMSSMEDPARVASVPGGLPALECARAWAVVRPGSGLLHTLKLPTRDWVRVSLAGLVPALALRKRGYSCNSRGSTHWMGGRRATKTYSALSSVNASWANPP